MKLSALYSNDEIKFPRIEFLEGLNVVYAHIHDPDDLNKDAHNLGKTFLIDVIEFCLLKDLEASHPFKRRKDLFGNFTFFLEIKSNTGQFITIRRNIDGRNSVSIQISNEGRLDLKDLSPNDWMYPNLSNRKSRSTLNDILELSVVTPYDYRKGVGYFLRRQRDYNDVFRLAKFAAGKDVDWKPFMAHLLGFDNDLVTKKYNLEKELEAAKQRLADAESEANTNSGEYDEVRALINAKSDVVERVRRQVDDFSFREVEEDISETLGDIVKCCGWVRTHPLKFRQRL